MIRGITRALLAVASSLGTSCVLLALLGILTWLGTLEQTRTGLFEVQRKYFESFFLVHQAGPVPIPLPGANLVMCLLAVNLCVGGLVRIRKNWSTAGILVAHVGIALLLLSALVKHRMSQDGHVTLFEGQRADQFQSYFRWEIALQERLDDSRAREWTVPHERIEAAGQAHVRVELPEVPFALEIERALVNCRPEWAREAAGDPAVVEGVRLVAHPVDPRAEANIAGTGVAVVDERDGIRRKALLWGAEQKPFTFTAAGRSWALSLRKERYPMPFAVELERFTKEDHPGIDMPRSFESQVVVANGTSEREVRISMNEPLRDGGLVLYQASWGPSNARPGQKLFSTLAVVRNPADQWPLVACLVIAAGLLLHFVRMLWRHVRLEARSA